MFDYAILRNIFQKISFFRKKKKKKDASFVFAPKKHVSKNKFLKQK